MSRVVIALVSSALAFSPVPAAASFHEARINEVMSGVGANPNLQYVEIRMLSDMQNFVANTRLTAFSCDGTSHTVLLVVPGNVLNDDASHRDWIMASPDDAMFFAASGIHPDFSFSPGIPPTCGMVCYGAPGQIAPNPASWDPADPNQYADCVAYGGYTGPKKTSTHDMTPASGTPSSLAAGDGTHSLTRTGDTQNNAADFSLACPNPTNNAGSSGTFGACTPPTTVTTTTVTTTTTSGGGPTTTSTTLTCGTGADFASIECREDALIAAIMAGQSEFTRPKFFNLILGRAQRLKRHTTEAAGLSGRKAKNRLKSAVRDVIGLNGALNSLTGKRSVSATERTALLAIATPLKADIKALRNTL